MSSYPQLPSFQMFSSLRSTSRHFLPNDFMSAVYTRINSLPKSCAALFKEQKFSCTRPFGRALFQKNHKMTKQTFETANKSSTIDKLTYLDLQRTSSSPSINYILTSHTLCSTCQLLPCWAALPASPWLLSRLPGMTDITSFSWSHSPRQNANQTALPIQPSLTEGDECNFLVLPVKNKH